MIDEEESKFGVPESQIERELGLVLIFLGTDFDEGDRRVFLLKMKFCVRCSYVPVVLGIYSCCPKAEGHL